MTQSLEELRVYWGKRQVVRKVHTIKVHSRFKGRDRHTADSTGPCRGTKWGSQERLLKGGDTWAESQGKSKKSSRKRRGYSR
jgi:hypothetical protein